MGVKRPYDEEIFQGLSFKQAKQLDEATKSIPILHESSEKDAVPGYVDDMELKTESGEDLLDDKADMTLQTSAALPWVTSSTADEEAGIDGAYYLPLYPDSVDTRQVPVHNEDSYSYLLSAAPSKGVPVGLNHQADIPEWTIANRKESVCFDDTIANDHGLNVVGTPIIPTLNPNFSFSNDARIGSGRDYCTCVDKNSIRCVHQHVEEARKKLKGSLGEQKFAGLGFHNMGEELASMWTDEEEYVFHEAIYSNPVSHGEDFWKSPSAVFPSRTTMELVSYYFNVFILRRRAVQNRSDFLDIDSDDDEWQGDGRHPEVEGRDDDIVVESLGDGDLHIDSELGISYNIYNDNGHGVRINRQDDTYMKGNQEEQVPPKPIEKLKEEHEVINQVNSMAKVLSSNNNSQAGIYLERNSYPLIHGLGGELSAVQEHGIKGEHIKLLCGKMNGTNESLGSGFILEGCDTKAWDYTFSTSHLKSIDLLPTCNMIEEIFGPCAWNN